MTYLTVPGGEIKPDQDHFKWKVWSVFSICSKTILQLVKQSVIPFHGYFRKTAEFQGTFINCKGGRGKWDFNALAGCKGQGGLHGEKYRCNLFVHFVAFTLALFLNHLVRYHTSDPNFHVLCGINGCSKTYRNCISFKNHIKRKHADLLLAGTEKVKLQNINIRTMRTIWMVIQRKRMKIGVKHTIVHLWPGVKNNSRKKSLLSSCTSQSTNNA